MDTKADLDKYLEYLEAHLGEKTRQDRVIHHLNTKKELDRMEQMDKREAPRESIHRPQSREVFLQLP